MKKPMASVVASAVVVTALGVVVGLRASASMSTKILPATTVTTSREIPPGAGSQAFQLVPVTSGTSPTISAEVAVKTAQAQEDLSRAASIEPQLAVFTDPLLRPVDANGTPTGPPLYEDVLAWVVTGSAVCAPQVGIVTTQTIDSRAASGAPSNEAPAACVLSNDVIVIDATSGEVIEDESFGVAG